MQINATSAARVRAAMDKKASAIIGLGARKNVNSDPMVSPCGSRRKAVPAIRPHLRRLNPILSLRDGTCTDFTLPTDRVVECTVIVWAPGNRGISAPVETNHRQETPVKRKRYPRSRAVRNGRYSAFGCISVRHCCPKVMTSKASILTRKYNVVMRMRYPDNTPDAI